jgi:SAM-dependent methyltransferase
MPCVNCESVTMRPCLVTSELCLLRCARCSLVQVKSCGDAYDLSLYDYYVKRADFSKERLYNALTTLRYENILKRFARYRQTNKLLDIGCGEGQLLHTAQRMGWDAQGVESCTHAAAICRRFGLHVECGNLLEAHYARGSFDVVTMIEVIEHLNKPKEFVSKSYELLRQGGVFYLTTPNFNCLARRLTGARWSMIHGEHLLYFTPATLTSLLRRFGFRVLSCKVKNISFAQICSIFGGSNCASAPSTNNLRETIEKNSGLKTLKQIANLILNLTGTGETIECLCQKI